MHLRETLVDTATSASLRLASPTTRVRRLHHVFENTVDRNPDAIALEVDSHCLSYRELDRRANQLAHILRERNIGSDARVAILLKRSMETYVSLLGVGKAGAVFVPIDPSSPSDRIAYIAEDAKIDLLITTADLVKNTEETNCSIFLVDEYSDILVEAAASRPDLSLEDELNPDPSAYVIYTSGSSGRPKGVEVAQSSICNFLDVVPVVYDVQPNDRVYQGMTISFDFSIEEIWPTWAVGATLVAGPTDSRRLGGELADFLEENKITTLYCVPTLLATLPRELPLIRNLLVGGEACPAQLVERWSRSGRRILNTYGPTEATVTATWGELLPGRTVTIGRPLPTYSVVLLDETREPVPDGEIGEICIGGPGVARGYVGRPDLTADRFIHHALAPAGSRLYRTGDLGRITADGEIEYLGRADAEVKIRGYRVDLGEIESVLLQDPQVAEAVTALMPLSAEEDAPVELAAYVVLSTEDVDIEELASRLSHQLSERLPAYMIPSFWDVVSELPIMPSGKVDRKRLPYPTGQRLAGNSGPVIAAEGDMELRVRAAWAEAFGLEPEALSVEADFFADLGGHSLLAARVVSIIRSQHADLNPAVRDLYANPTIRGMAARLSSVMESEIVDTVDRPKPLRHSTFRIARSGFVQAIGIYLLLLLITLPVAYVYTANDGDVSVEVLVQLMIAILVSYLGVRWVVPLVVVRALTAGIKPGRYRLWGWTYLRLWMQDLLLAIGPLTVVSGSPLMGMYLRVLGAKVGRRTTVTTSSISMPRLVTIDPDASVGYGVALRPWKVEDGWVVVAPISIGRGAYVGANAVLEPGSIVSEYAMVAEQSVLSEGECVPPRARWSGSPALPSEKLDPTLESMMDAEEDLKQWRWRHFGAALLGLAGLELGAIVMILPGVALVWWALLTWGVLAGLIATVLAGPVFVITVCALVALGKRLVLPKVPIGIHPFRSGLGVRKWIVDKLLEFSLVFTNSLYATLYTAPWLRLLGAKIGKRAEVSTAAHLDPHLLTIGEESFIADMASVGTATFANGRISLLPTEVGNRAFVGNAAFVPAGTKMGNNALIGVGTVPPYSGVPEDTSWLGSPAIYLPQRQDSGSFSERETFAPPRKIILQRLGIEFFRATLPASLLGVSFYLFLLALSSLANGRDLPIPAFVSPLVAIFMGALVIAFCAATKRNLVGEYHPRVEPLWSPFVRRSEFATGLYESAAVPAGVGILVGTPFLPPILRWFGVQVGRRTWIGTTYLTEFDLVQIGDDATVGTESSLQTHLFEDRVMKMSRVIVEACATIGTRAIVLYDAVIGEETSLGSLSLAMKGERLPQSTRWRGIPAQNVRSGALTSG